jgi:hypothetical protein
VFYAERGSGAGSRAGDAIRARHRERLEARANGQGELDRVIEGQKRQLREQALREFRSRSGNPGKARWASLTRDERNALRRQEYRARRNIERQDPEAQARRREVSRRRYHESFSADPEAVRERRRRYRQLHADEINRKQRAYRKTHSVELNLRRRELRRLTSPTPDESARAWLADRQGHAAAGNAERAAEDWSLSGARANQPERDGADGRGTDSSLQGGPGKGATGDAQDDDARQVNTRRDRDLEM